MKNSFPKWSDIRKRTENSTGGSYLSSIANEFNDIWKAILDYRKMFFLLNYKDKESDIIDYLYMAQVGDIKDIEIPSLEVKYTVTDNTDEFYNNASSTVLYQGGYLFFDERILPQKVLDSKLIEYKTDDCKYMTALTYEHIWNVFDEFAYFAGLKRYDGERNLELSNRIYQLFKEFPNPTYAGIKNAIKTSVDGIDDDDIQIVRFDDADFDLTDPAYKNIYEKFLQYNRDVFRAKVWNQDKWENTFQRTEYIPHVWDEPMEITQNGVGYNDSLKSNYVKQLSGVNETTDVDVSCYKKDFEKIRQYIGKNNVETSIMLTLTKYSNEVKPKEVKYSIKASDVLKLDSPQTIYINGTKTIKGERQYYIDDMAVSLENVSRIEKAALEPNVSYKLRFTPKTNFSDMNIEKCELKYDSGHTDLRKEYSYYALKNGIIKNANVKSHITDTSMLVKNDNIEDSIDGFTIGQNGSSGVMYIDVTGMERQLINYESSCRRVDITESSYVRAANGFIISNDKYSYTNNGIDSLGTIHIGGEGHELYCNSLSFSFLNAETGYNQGSIAVTYIVNGETERVIYNKGTDIVKDFGKRTLVEVIIQKYGQNPVTIKNIRMCSYDIKFDMSDGSGVVSTGRNIRLPDNIGEKLLRVTITPYSNAFPVIKYIHIGGSLKGARYELDFNTNGKANPKLDIDTDCNITLYKIVSGKAVIVGEENQYCTKAVFVNNTTSDGYIVIDVSKYAAIIGSSPAINKTLSGTVKSYITLRQGQSIQTIIINGEMKKTLYNKSLTSYLFGEESIADKQIYITNSAGGALIVKNTANNSISKKFIEYSDLDSRADSYTFVNLPQKAVAKFVTSNGQSNLLSGTIFKLAGIEYQEAKNYISYTASSVISSETDNVEIVNTFSPSMDMNTLRYYEISVGTEDSSVVFANSKSSWSLGISSLTIKTKIDSNNKSTWQISVNNISNKYILANEVPLDDRYLIDGEYHSLSEFIIDTEKGIDINYEKHKNISESFTVPSSMITKLQYSNVSDICLSDGATILNSGFTVMPKEGLIVWNNKVYQNANITATYTLNNPVSLSYNSDYEDKLYDLITFSVDAYKLVDNIVYKNCIDGWGVSLNLKEKPDKIITKCSNAVFTAAVLNNQLSVGKLKDSNKIAVHNGYIYDQGYEYYYFNDRFIDSVDRFANIELYDCIRQNGNLLLNMHSKNYLPYSNMRTSLIEKLCSFDFKKRMPNSISKFNHLTACDSFNMWYTVNMKLAIVDDIYNDYGIKFQAQTRIGYAALDITKYFNHNDIISVIVTGNLKAYIVKEHNVDGLTMHKSVYINLDDAKEFKVYNVVMRYYIVDEEKIPDTKYYIVLVGKSGIIDDLMSLKFTTLEDCYSSHTKNINKLNFNIAEKMPVKYEYDLDFDLSGAKYKDLAYNTSTNELTTSSNIEYGLTNVCSVDLAKCELSMAQQQKNKIVSVSDNAKIITKPVYIHSRNDVHSVYIKINDIITGPYKNFTINIYGSNSQSGNYRLLASRQNCNMAVIRQNLVCSYIYAEIIADKNKIIHSIDVYARYAELDPERPLTATDLSSGEYISKIYDLGTESNYIFNGVDAEVTGEPDEVSYYIRGLREGKLSQVFTPWRKYTGEDEIRYDGYSLFQFKIKINSPKTILKVNKFRMVVAG